VSKTKNITVYCEENGGDVPVKVATPDTVLERIVLQLLGKQTIRAQILLTKKTIYFAYHFEIFMVLFF